MLIFSCVRPYSGNKLQPRSTECVFLGGTTKHHMYVCFDWSRKRMYISKHVVFSKSHFPFYHMDQFPCLSFSPNLNATIFASFIVPLVPCQPIDHSNDVLPFNLASHSDASRLSEPIVSYSSKFGVHNIGTQYDFSSMVPLKHNKSLARNVMVGIPIRGLPTSVSAINNHPMLTRSKERIIKP